MTQAIVCRRHLSLAALALVLLAGLAACTGPAAGACEEGVADISRIGTVVPPACP